MLTNANAVIASVTTRLSATSSFRRASSCTLTRSSVSSILSFRTASRDRICDTCR